VRVSLPHPNPLPLGEGELFDALLSHGGPCFVMAHELFRDATKRVPPPARESFISWRAMLRHRPVFRDPTKRIPPPHELFRDATKRVPPRRNRKSELKIRKFL